MHRYKITIEYIGTHMVGWQRQPDCMSVQGALEDAVFGMTGDRVEVFGAGRTDAGVHATAQVAHFDTTKEWDPYKLMQGLNHHLYEGMPLVPCPVSVLHAEAVDQEFHSRFSATRRHYQYLIVNRPARLTLMAGRAWFVPEPLDIGKMQAAANFLTGRHDFSSFRDSQCQAKSPLKSLDYIEISRAGQMIMANLHAPSFLHHQVRIIIGTLWQAGTGRMEPEEMKAILDAKDRKVAGPTAPSDGLYLTGVDYGSRQNAEKK